MNFDKLKAAVAAAASEAGVGEYEIYYTSSTDTSVEGLNRELNSFSSSTAGGLCLRVFVGGKMGYASTELMEENEMRELVLRAVDNAANTEKLEETGLFVGSPSYEEPRMKPCEPLEAADLKRLTLDVMEKCYAKSDKVTDGTSSRAIAFSSTVRIVNSHGLDLENSCAANALIADAVVAEGDEKQSDFAIKIYDETTDTDEMAKKAVDDALSKIGATLVDTGKYDVIISGEQMRSILSAFSPAFSAKNAQMGLSLLAGKEGSVIAAPCVTVTDDPMREGSTVGTTFDDEGVATHRKTVIEKGVLKTLLHNRETAKRAGVETTANASKASYASPVGISPYVFCIEAGTLSGDELLEKMGDGILVTEVKGLHAGANSVTGDFSIESAGYMVRGGKRAEAVKSFTIAGNFFELIKNIDSVANEVKVNFLGTTTFGSPDVLVRGMSVAGK